MRTASTALPPVLYGTLRSALIGYGAAAFTWLFTRSGLIEDPLAANASSAARQLFAWGIACQIVALVARWLIRRRYGVEPDSTGTTLSATVEILADGVTVLLFAIATFRGFVFLGDSL